MADRRRHEDKFIKSLADALLRGRMDADRVLEEIERYVEVVESAPTWTWA